MTEHVLDYDHSIVPQETYYNCGPASTQVVLNGQEVYVTEQELAAQMGTDEEGTDHVGLIEDTLDNYVPNACYAEVYLHHDPPTPEQKEDLWHHLTSSIDAGKGVVMNWIAPPSNYPVGVKGSTSPSYGGGTVFHYVACMGYDDDPALRACWIADSGFSPFGYWCAFDQVISLIPNKGYTYSALTPPPPEEPMPDYSQLSFEQLAGPDADEGSYGWTQLGGRTVVDAIAVIGSELGIDGFEPPNLARRPETETGEV